MPPLQKQLRWLIGIRLVVVTSLVLPYFLLQLSTSSPEPAADFLYALAGITYVASLVYIGLLSILKSRYLSAQAYFQFVGDLILITGLVYYFGGITSPFSMLYLIVISVAATLLRRRAGIRVAEVAWLMYAALVLSLYYEWIPHPGPASDEPAWRLIYRLVVHLFGFYAVALMTFYLAKNVTRAEQELEEKRENLAELQVVHRDVIASIASGLITTNLEGTVTSVNRAGAQILGRPQEELLGKPIFSSGLFDEDGWRRLSATSHRRGKVRDEVNLPCDGGPIPIGFSVNEYADREGRQLGYILIFQDLTDWRKLQEEVRLKDRMAAVGELAAGLAHEIGNPLAAISGSVQMLSNTVPQHSSRGKLLDIILQESRRLDRTIKNFLQFARPRERSVVPFDIARLLQENVELLRNSEEVSPDHLIEAELIPISAQLSADPDQISQIFWNLARNALRAMPDGGTLKVSGELRGKIYRIRFSDTGSGMSEKERANLFHPFQSFFDGGVGIGMAIVYRIVEEHGGRLDVSSQPGSGTTISVELPVTRSRELSMSVGA